METAAETRQQVRQSINVTALATLLVALFAAIMGRTLNATLLSLASLALTVAAHFLVVPGRRARPRAHGHARPEPALCAHL